MIKHWPENKHFKAVTDDGRKFVFCPVGQICSWHPGDYDNEYCHWCKIFYVAEKNSNKN